MCHENHTVQKKDKKLMIARVKVRDAEKEVQRILDEQTSEFDEEACDRRWIGAKRDSMKLVGLLRRRVTAAAKRRARKSTGCTTARIGRRCEIRCQRILGSGADGENVKGRVEVARRSCASPAL